MAEMLATMETGRLDENTTSNFSHLWSKTCEAMNVVCDHAILRLSLIHIFYCYANYDKKTVAENIRFHDPASPFLIGGFREGDIIKEAKQESYFDAQLRLF